MVKKRIVKDLENAVVSLGFKTTDPLLSIPENSKFGDYSTNLPLQLAKQEMKNGNQSPIEIANQLLSKIMSDKSASNYLEKVEVAGAGFLNFFLKASALVESLTTTSDQDFKFEMTEKYLVEYGHVNLLKEIHIGHLRTFILGESICRILEVCGNSVFRANYQGDIGLHIAKAIWGINQSGLPTWELSSHEKAEFLGRAYAEGNKAYESDPSFKQEIDKLNNRLYQDDPELQTVYELAKKWSLEYFQPIYQLLGISYDHYFFESQVANLGKSIVLENVGKVFEENEGAVIFPGEKYGLHTRVFITSAGNPTYEAKELGLAKLEYQQAAYDHSIHVVADEQTGYFQVVFKAIELIFPWLIGKKYHLAYGFVDLKSGKMSSRTGNVVTVDELVKVVEEAVRQIMQVEGQEVDQQIVRVVAVGAIKFAYLKFSPRPNMVFDLQESVSLTGDSGPYVQYSFVRAQSILKNAAQIKKLPATSLGLTAQERAILIRLENFSDLVKTAAVGLKPNLICEYLLDLCHQFNLFYQKERVIGSDKEGLRILLTQRVSWTLKKGLGLLGIEVPERM